MQELTSRERIERILHRQPVDRVGLYETFWSDTQRHWIQQGHLKEGEDLIEHFDMDLRLGPDWNSVANLEFQEQVIDETDEWKLVRDGNGALLKWWKNKSGTPEHVDFLVKDRAGWEEHIRPRLLDESRLRDRANVEEYRKARERAAREERFFCWVGINVFELMHPVCGHEYMLMGMALDPDWVQDMCEVYSDLTIKIQQILFSECGAPDGVWFYEDMGFKGKPFLSPAMYKEIVWPAHKKTFEYAHSVGRPVIVHSCGFVEPLVPGLIEAGMDCLQAMEVKAGMDLVELKKKYGDRIAFCGGMDVRTLESNDLKQVEAELQKKLPTAMEGSGYILHTDHSVSTQMEYETLKYFQQRGLEIGNYSS